MPSQGVCARGANAGAQGAPGLRGPGRGPTERLGRAPPPGVRSELRRHRGAGTGPRSRGGGAVRGEPGDSRCAAGRSREGGGAATVRALGPGLRLARSERAVRGTGLRTGPRAAARRGRQRFAYRLGAAPSCCWARTCPGRGPAALPGAGAARDSASGSPGGGSAASSCPRWLPGAAGVLPAAVPTAPVRLLEGAPRRPPAHPGTAFSRHVATCRGECALTSEPRLRHPEKEAILLSQAARKGPLGGANRVIPLAANCEEPRLRIAEAN